jgi:amino acid adenylation domain-containing protein
MIEHRGVANAAAAQRDAFALVPADRVLQFASSSFDASIFELLLAFGAGASLHLATADQLLPGRPLAALLREQQITVAVLPPSALASLPEGSYPALRTLIVAGEACPQQLARRWAGGGERVLVNAYGPTECSIWATSQRLEPGERVTIGRPVRNTRVYVLDARLAPQPIGVVGEIYLGGAGVARGYVDRPELTAERFVPDPFGPPGARLYRTGDLALVLPDGRIDYVGRTDRQVKVRGFRIELAEIEAALSAHPAVERAAVIVDGEMPETRRLVGFVALRDGGEATTAELREFLQRRIAEHMVPSVLVRLAAIPLTQNGKIDYRALPKAVPDNYKTRYSCICFRFVGSFSDGIRKIFYQRRLCLL